MSHAQTENEYTRGIAEFVASLEYDAIPEEVRERIGKVVKASAAQFE